MGRLEVYFQGEWGTVCLRKDWDYGKLPETVCRQIGLGEGKALLSVKEFARGKGRIWLDGVWCNGTEDGIDACQHAAWGSKKCDHSTDIGIKCDGMY